MFSAFGFGASVGSAFSSFAACFANLALMIPFHGVLVAEEELCEGLGQLGLAHPGAAEEDEGADRPVGVAQARAAAADIERIMQYKEGGEQYVSPTLKQGDNIKLFS